jgi:conjugative transposon TraK protein
MLKQFKNIDQAFKYIRTFSIVLIIAQVATTCYVTYAFLQEMGRREQIIHVISNGKLLDALAANRQDYVAVEVRDHVRMFHFHFFTLDPDDEVIQRNIGKALYLADGSAKKQYDNLKENGYYSGIVSGNISQRIEEDSIQVNLEQKPYYFRYYGRQKIIRATSIVTRSLITEGYIRDGLSPSDHNPHGYLIERWLTLENKDLKVESRN